MCLVCSDDSCLLSSTRMNVNEVVIALEQFLFFVRCLVASMGLGLSCEREDKSFEAFNLV